MGKLCPLSLVACFLSLCALPVLSAGVSLEDKLLWDYVASIYGKSAFYSSCSMGPGAKAFIVMPVGEVSGRFFMMQDGGMLLGFGDVTLQDGVLRVEGVSGGMTESAIATNIGDQLLRGIFRLLGKKEFVSIRSDWPNLPCGE